MGVVSKEIVLVGPHKGKTIVLGGIQFKDGSTTLTGPEADVEKQFKYLHRCWQVQYADQVEEAEDGSVQDTSSPDENGAPQGDSGEGEQGSAQEGAADAPVTNQRLLDAVMKLDPENDEHWTRIGKPAMQAVEGFYGSADITRADIEAAAPGFTRETAQEQAKG